jgi:hypothetical protein
MLDLGFYLGQTFAARKVAFDTLTLEPGGDGKLGKQSVIGDISTIGEVRLEELLHQCALDRRSVLLQGQAMSE